MTPVIQAKNLSFTYAGNHEKALNNINLSISEGECVVLCGISGCGKTTLTRIFNGLAPAFYKGELSGSCEVFGLKCGKDAIEKFVPVVGSVFQNPKTQYFCTTTTEELAFPCENAGYPSSLIQSRIDECINEMQISALMDRSIFHLSGGEKQKIAFASAQMLRPKLLVLDEPTSNLDDSSILQLRDLLIEAKKKNITIVIAEHRLAWTLDFADTYICFENGCLTDAYSKDAFKSLSDDALKKKGLRSVRVKEVHKKNEPDEKSAYLEARDLVAGYKKHAVLSIPALKIHKGEILGIMGRNGIGKSTLIKTLCGLMKPLKGEIYIDGRNAKENMRIRNSFQVMQDVNYQLFADSVEEEILLGSDENDCRDLLEKMNLSHLKDKHPMTLSGGQKQRTVIASSVLVKKDIIYFDEPTSGLDHYHMEKAGDLLKELKKMNKAVVVVTHDADLVNGYCDRVINLENMHEYK